MEHPERLGHGEHAHTTDASADRTEPQPEPDVEGKTPETGEFPLRLATNPRSSVVQPRRKQAYLARRWLAMGLATLALLALAIGVMARLALPVSASGKRSLWIQLPADGQCRKGGAVASAKEQLVWSCLHYRDHPLRRHRRHPGQHEQLPR